MFLIPHAVAAARLTGAMTAMIVARVPCGCAKREESPGHGLGLGMCTRLVLAVRALALAARRANPCANPIPGVAAVLDRA